MLYNYLKTAIRTFRSKPGYTLINVFGLACGLACFLLLSIYVTDEFSYDNFHEDGDKIYRIAGRYDQGGDEKNESAIATYLLGPRLNQFSSIDEWVRLDFSGAFVQKGDQLVQEDEVLYADSSFFSIFTFPLKSGDKETALDEVNSVVINERIEKKYFNDDALNQLLVIDGTPLKVTGVMYNIQPNSHFTADFVISMRTAVPNYPNWVLNNRTGTSHHTYIKLTDSKLASQFESELNAHIEEVYEDSQPEYFLQPLEKIHLHSQLNAEIEANGDITYTYVFMSIAIMILLIACINYTNLAIAKSSTRMKEIGVRKTIGASKGQLRMLYLSESVLMAVIAVIIGGLIAELSMPLFNELSGKSIELSVVTNIPVLLALIGGGVLVGLLSGAYPAFYLSQIQSLKVLKGQTVKLGGGVVTIRKLLLTFQFLATSVLLIGTIFIFKQLNYMSTQNLGINTAEVLYFPLGDSEVIAKYQTMKSELERIPSVSFVGASNNDPTRRVGNWRNYELGEKSISMSTIIVDHDYFNVLEIETAEGRVFSKDFISDKTEAYVLNESAANFLELDDPIGAELSGLAFTGRYWSQKQASIVGIVKDFHFTSLHDKIQPTIFSLSSEITIPLNYVLVRVAGDDVNTTISQIETVWNKSAEGRPFDLNFLDQSLNDLYQGEKNFLKVFVVFSIITVIIACLGALGLVSYTVNQLTKQIGIRKALGSSSWGILKLVNSSYAKLMLISFFLAIPLSYKFVTNWLDTFAYRIEIGVFPFVQAAFVLLIIGVLTTSYQSIKAASINPAKTLKED